MTQGLCPAQRAKMGAQDPPPPPYPTAQDLGAGIRAGAARSRVRRLALESAALAGEVSLDGSMAGLKG